MENRALLPLTNIPNELQLIIELLKGKEPDLNQATLEKIDWQNFVKLERHHRVYPLLYFKLKTTPNIPNQIFQITSQDYKQNIFQMLQLSGEMEHINSLCLQNKVPVLFLKGPFLGLELYGDISLRTSSDLDILIPMDNLREMETILSEEGYIKDDYIKTVLNDWKWRHHHVTFFHPEKKVKLEVHWRLNPGPGKEPTFTELWENRNSCQITDSKIHILGKEDLFIFLITHGARHGWSRLRWLVDVQKLILQDLNWEKVKQTVKKYGYSKITGQAMILLEEMFESKIPEEFVQFMSRTSQRLAKDTLYYFENIVSLHSDFLPLAHSQHHKRYLFMSMSLGQKALFILSFLYPYPEDAETLPLPKKYHFLYFPLRPALWAWRKMRKRVKLLGEKV